MTPSSQPPGSAAEAHLRGLLELSALMDREPRHPVSVLPEAARIVSRSLGFGTVALLLSRSAHEDLECAALHEDRPRLAGGELGSSRLPTGGLSCEDLLGPEHERRPIHVIGGVERPPPDAPVPSAVAVGLDAPRGRRHGLLWLGDPRGRDEDGDPGPEVLIAFAATIARGLEAAERRAELEVGRARRRALIESSPDPVIAIDRQGRVVEFNRAAEMTFGYSAQESIGQELGRLLVAPEHRGAHRRGVRRARRGEWRMLDRRFETVALRADGSRVPVEVTLAPVEQPIEGAPFVYGFVRDISERRSSEEQLAFMAYHDPLTGLPNRILVEQQLDLALARARRRRGAVALMFVDLDDFKDVNDRFGHHAGDRLLCSVTARLRAVLRDSDLLARQGGDEFIVLLADIAEDPHAAAELVAAKLLEALREPFAVEGAEARTGASIGISVYPHDATDTQSLLRHADVAMYQAKSLGGGRVAFHRVAPEVRSRRQSLSDQLLRAMSRHELELHYQTIWELGDSPAPWGVEALLRWRHPERGLLAPQAFLSMAEQSAVGDEILEWIVRELCRQGRDWKQAGLAPRLSLNVSPQQLHAPAFAVRLVEQLAAGELEPEQLLVELSESAWSVDAAEALVVIAQLRTAGVGLAIDDFGAGCSSLGRLRELGVDVIKLDRGLLAGVTHDPLADALLGAAAEIGRACEARLVAQGVETSDQLAHLAGHGIGLAQGFLLARPEPAAQTTARLRARRPAQSGRS